MGLLLDRRTGGMVGSGPSELPFAAVEAKIQRPVHRDGLVARTKLLDVLAATPDHASLILLTAPAGYGKTTVLSQWAAEDSREFAWVTVDEADGDPVRMAGHVALALHRIQPLDPAVFRALAVGDGPRHLAALAPLLTSLRTWSRPGVLVLDDVHELGDVAAMNFIRALAAGLPAGFHLAVGSRLTLGFGRLRSEDRLVEFGVEDLAFSEGRLEPSSPTSVWTAPRTPWARWCSAPRAGRLGCIWPRSRSGLHRMPPWRRAGSAETTRTSWTTSGTSCSPGSLRRPSGS